MLSVAFCEFFFANLPILGIFIKLVGSSLFSIGANKGLHDISGRKGVMFFFLLERCSSLVTGLLTLYAVSYKNNVHGAFVFVLVAHS